MFFFAIKTAKLRSLKSKYNNLKFLNILEVIGKNIFQLNKDPRPIIQNILYSDMLFSEILA